MYLTVVPTKGGNAVTVTSDEATIISRYVSNLTPNEKTHVVLFANDPIQTKFNQLIPSSWLSQILPFIQIDEIFQSQIGPYGIEVDLSKITNYNQWYQTLITNIADSLKNMYFSGYLVDPSKEIIDNWKLLPIEIRSFYDIDSKTNLGVSLEKLEPGLVPVSDSFSNRNSRLYYASWVDGRITETYGGMTGFLLSRLQGIDYIDYDLSTDDNPIINSTESGLFQIRTEHTSANNVNASDGLLVRRHFVAKILKDYSVEIMFHRSFIRFTANNLEQTQMILALITEGISNSNGKVITFSVTRLSWLKLYRSVSFNLGYNDCIGYKINDPQRPYMFSCVIDPDLNLISEYHRFAQGVTDLLRRAEEIFTDKTISIHDAIERNLIELK